ncbi:hypothetical protein GVAV_000689 [Gurleya vavrai]
MTNIKKSMQPVDYVLYSTLTIEEKNNLATFCSEKIKKINDKGFIKKTWCNLKKMFNKKDCLNTDVINDDKKINEIYEDLLKNSPNTHLIFGTGVLNLHFEENIKKQKGMSFKLNKKTTHEKAAILRGYFKEIDGLFNQDILQKLVKMSGKFDLINSKHKDAVKLRHCLPFCSDSFKRNLLIKLLDLWDAIDKNSYLNEMSIKNLCVCCGPMIFSKKIFSMTKDFKKPSELAHMIYHLDYERINKDLYSEFQKWLNK